jgi:hypothetical protein
MRPTVQVRLSSVFDLVRSTLEPYVPWITKTIGTSLDETLTLEVDTNPGDLVAEELLEGIPVVSATKARIHSWQSLVESWSLPTNISPRLIASLQRERKPKSAPSSVWELDWQDCPVSFKFKGLSRSVISVHVPLVFPPGDSFAHTTSKHWLIVHREDAAKILLLIQQVQTTTARYLQTTYGRTRLGSRYDWNSVVLDATARRLVRTDFELFFEREEWFRQHNLPYRRGYLFWGDPGNGKSATIRVMASHPYIRAYALDLSDLAEKNSSVHALFEEASENTPALIILEDIDRAFPTEGKRTPDKTVTFQTLLNCLDGVGTRDGVIVVATANDPTKLDPAVLQRPGRFDRVVWFRNPDAELRREYYQRLNPILSGNQFGNAIQKTEGFSFAQLRETYILASQSAFEHGRDIVVGDVIEAIDLQTAGAREVKRWHKSSGFVRSAKPKLESERGA